MNHTSGGVTIHTLDAPILVGIGSVTNVSVPLGTVTQSDDGGQIWDKTRSTTNQSPMPTASTKAIDLCLQNIPQQGICLRTDATHPGVSFYGQLRETCGATPVVPGVNDHIQYLTATGLMVPLSLSGARGTDMEFSFEIDALTDGTNAPIAVNEGVPLPAPASLDLSQWVIGSMKIADIVFDDVQDFNLDYNVARSEKTPKLGRVWPETVSTSKAQPVVTVSGRNPRRFGEGAGQIGWDGTSALKTTTQFKFRKRLDRGKFDPGNVHIVMSMNGYVVCDNPFDASGASRANTTFRILGIEDAGNAPLAFAYNQPYSDF